MQRVFRNPSEKGMQDSSVTFNRSIGTLSHCSVCGSFHFRTKFEVSLDLSGIQIGNFVCMHLSSAVFCDTKDMYKIEQADPNIFEGSMMLVDAVYVWGVNQTSNVQYSSRRQSSI